MTRRNLIFMENLILDELIIHLNQMKNSIDDIKICVYVSGMGMALQNYKSRNNIDYDKLKSDDVETYLLYYGLPDECHEKLYDCKIVIIVSLDVKTIAVEILPSCEVADCIIKGKIDFGNRA